MRTIGRGTLVVSCQARDDNPLTGPAFMRAMALASTSVSPPAAAASTVPPSSLPRGAAARSA
jgi:putative N-acetylmannosamine-6-phosphate epimerase